MLPFDCKCSFGQRREFAPAGSRRCAAVKALIPGLAAVPDRAVSAAAPQVAHG